MININTSQVVSTSYSYRKYFYAGSTRIAMRYYPNGGGYTKYYLFSDHHGCRRQPRSQSLTANSDGAFYSEVKYTAFGETRYSSQNETPSDH